MSMDQLSNPPSTSWPVQTNELFQTLDHQACYGQHQSEHAGLTWGYYGGRWGGFSVADGTHTLTNAANNYIVVLRSNGVPSVSTSNTNWNDAANYARVYKVTTAGGVVTAIEDHRAGPGGVHGQIDPSAGVVDADEVGIADSGAYYTGTDVEAALQEIGASLAGLGGLVDVLVFAGVIDCSANPNYPAADAGAVYVVSVAGKIGGSSGPNVEAGDTLICRVDSSASGNHATVGANWTILQRNIDGAVTGPTSATDSRVARFDGTTGKLIKDGGTDAALVGDAIHAATGKTTPVDADELGLIDSAASNVLKKLTWANLKATLKTYFDTLYTASSSAGSSSAVVALSITGGAVSIDCSLGDYFTLTLTENVTSITFSNLPGAGRGTSKWVQITQGAGPYTVSWPGSFKWAGGSAGTVSTANGSVDELALTTVDNGSTWKVTLAKAFA